MFKFPTPVHAIANYKTIFQYVKPKFINLEGASAADMAFSEPDPSTHVVKTGINVVKPFRVYVTLNRTSVQLHPMT